MLYTMLCYNDEDVTTAWTEEEDAAVMARLKVVHRKWAKNFKPIVRLMPTSAATTLRKTENVVLDGPFAETKEQLLGLYILDVENLDVALQIARDLTEANPGGAYELRPVWMYYPDGEAIDDDPAS
ncbi:YCII-related domain protein [Hartmannibacter diazotrophicus]|uniref:YCII-related domain protein n=1 Tax=Hartmannibacter diazotrophicus TaxID=1482074 RepID=A0A2C9D8V6_9HYPH|nr:YciI family protein [Hartmannibacter diazotrophicus]SON56737.1 YCII-related domain protein [Hartmannibacter diazotrophicus]